MEAGTQSALLIVWGLFWMLALTVVLAHPLFRPNRMQIRRTLRLNLNRWHALQHRIRGHILLRLGKALLWLAHRLEQKTSPPLWLRLLFKLIFDLGFIYLFWHLLFHQPMNWSIFLGMLLGDLSVEGARAWRKRKKQRLLETSSGESAAIKSVQEQPTDTL